MIREQDAPLGVRNYWCPTCHVLRGFKCVVGGVMTEDVHVARLRAYRADHEPCKCSSEEGQESEGGERVICACGYEDCWYAELGYFYCWGCDQHHRTPVAEGPEGFCPVDLWNLRAVGE